MRDQKWELTRKINLREESEQDDRRLEWLRRIILQLHRLSSRTRANRGLIRDRGNDPWKIPWFKRQMRKSLKQETSPGLLVTLPS